MMNPRFRTVEKIAFYTLLVLNVIYIWVMPVYLTQDGPSHLMNSWILKELLLHGKESVFAQFYELNVQGFPNWLSSILYVILLLVFKPLLAEKVFLSLLVASLALAFRLAVVRVNKDSAFLSSLGYSFANGYFLIAGFFNFQWGIVFFLLFLSQYIHSKERMSNVRAIGLSALAIIAYFCHPVPLMLIYFIVGFDFIRNVYHSRIKVQKSKGNNHLVHYLIIILPSMTLLVRNFLLAGSSEAPMFTLKPLYIYAKALIPLQVFSNLEYGTSILFLSILIYAILTKQLMSLIRSATSKASTLLLTMMACILVYFFVNDELSGGAYITARIVIFLYILTLLIAAMRAFSPVQRNWILGAAILLQLSTLTIRYPIQHEIGSLAEDYLNSGQIFQEEAIILPLTYSNRGEIASTTLSPRIRVFEHMSNYLGTSNQNVVLENYEAETIYFPLCWKTELNPYQSMKPVPNSEMELNPPVWDLRDFIDDYPMQIDFIILWGDIERMNQIRSLSVLQTQIDQEFVLVHESEVRLTRIFEKRSSEE